MKIDKYLEMAKVDMEEIRYEPGQKPDLSSYDILQPKYDGWFAIAVGIGKGMFEVYSRGGEVITTIDTDRLSNKGDVLIGEFMYGTNWAQTHYTNQFVVYDILIQTTLVYEDRFNFLEDYVKTLNSKWIRVIEIFPVEMFLDAWDSVVDLNGFEGLVAKNFKSVGLPKDVDSCKIKKMYTMDYVCMDMNEGKGRNAGKLGALVGGLFIDGKLTKVCSVGGGLSDEMRKEFWDHSEKYIGKVFEAAGWAVFSSGALRHPTFKRFRKDKKLKECVWRLEEKYPHML